MPTARVPWIQAGLVGGLLAGLADGIVTVLRRVGGLGAPKAAWLVVLCAAAIGICGMLLGAAAEVAAGRRPDRGPTVAAAALAPIIWYDAFALFSGHRAAQIPAHHIFSVALAAGGSAGVWFAFRAFVRLLDAPPRRRFVAASVLAAAALALDGLNRLLLPRLYPWFHASLAVATFVLAVLAARLAVAEPGPRRTATAVLAGVAVVAGGLAIRQARRSQILRYAAFEKTTLSALALRPMPAALGPRTLAAAERPVVPTEPPLPDGPRVGSADVFLITIDALRADHVGAYGYRRPTTPNLDALAARGVRFERAYAQAPHTSFSVASMLTGKYFPTLARLAPGGVHDPIADVLRRYGWKTAAFYPPSVFFVDAQKLRAYQESNFRFEYVKIEFLDARKRLDQIRTYFDAIKPARAFVWVHYFEPHEPYESRAGFDFGGGDVDRYDSEIAYADAAVGLLLDYVARERPGSIVVVAADHGEEFDEHGGRYHGSTLYEEQLRIPLVIAAPGVAPRVVDGPVELIDVAPTVLRLLDIPVPVRMRGTDLGPWLGAASPPAGRLPPAFAEVEDKRMIVSGTDKLVCVLSAGFCEYFDLLADPHEQRNLADERPVRAAALRADLDRWLDGHVRFEPEIARGLANPDGGAVPRAIERGRLGDVGAARDLAALARPASGAPPEVRREAARLCATLAPVPDIAPALHEALGDTDHLVADWAAVAALGLGDAAAAARVREVVARADAEPELRTRAALSLVRQGDGAGLPALAESLDRCDDLLLCRTAIVALGRLRDPRAVPALLGHLREVQNRREMVAALGEIGGRDVVEPLVASLETDEYVNVRIEAARALGRLGDRRARVALEAAAGHDEPAVAAAAKEALARLPAAGPATRRRR